MRRARVLGIVMACAVGTMSLSACGQQGRDENGATDKDATAPPDGRTNIAGDAGPNDSGPSDAGASDGGHHTVQVPGAGAIDVWTHVWCPDAPNSGQGFHPLASFDDLPNDPLGDGENNCYMEAFDTSVFSTDGHPVRNCANLDLSKFPGHTCMDVSDTESFQNAMTASGKVVAVVTGDIEVDHSPFIAGQQESRIIIGAYDEATMRPVLITTPPDMQSTLLNWSSHADPQSLTVINLRLHTAGMCFSVGRARAQATNTFQSVTAKCGGRFIMGSFEDPTNASWSAGPDYPNSVPDLTEWPIDDRTYFRRVMTRGNRSHTVYLDHSYLDWVEDSIIMVSFTSGKHAAKFIGQNVYLHNSIFTNTGIHNEPIVDPEFSDTPRSSNLAALSLIACSRVVIDRCTFPYHYDPAEANARPIQWQIRDSIGGACDLPWSYYPNLYPTVPYRGPADWLGQHYDVTPFWDDSWWASIDDTDPLDPNMITSIITSNRIHLTVTDSKYIPYLYALGTVGTYPTTREDSGSASNFRPPSDVPSGWKERQRIIVNNNCFDDGLSPDNLTQNYVVPGMGAEDDPYRHAYDNTDKFIVVGSNRCQDVGTTEDWIRQAEDAFLDSLPPPPWENWQ